MKSLLRPGSLITFQFFLAEAPLKKLLELSTRHIVGQKCGPQLTLSVFDIAEYQFIHFRLSPFIGPGVPMKLDGHFVPATHRYHI